MRLSENIAIVTGSDSGIGAAIAVRFAKEGADVVVTWHTDQEGAKKTLDAVRNEGCRGFMHQVDVADEASVEALFAAVDDQLGTPSLLVCNSGTDDETSSADLTTADFDHVIKTDLYGPFLCARAFIQRRRAVGGRGKIINVSSVHDRIPSPKHLPYGTAKGGVLTMTRTLALELAPMKINVNAIAPGQIRTPMTQQRIDDPQTHTREMANVPWHRPGEPEEIARLAAYLASEEADYVTGQSIAIDGGLTMNWGQGA